MTCPLVSRAEMSKIQFEKFITLKTRSVLRILYIAAPRVSRIINNILIDIPCSANADAESVCRHSAGQGWFYYTLNTSKVKIKGVSTSQYIHFTENRRNRLAEQPLRLFLHRRAKRLNVPAEDKQKNRDNRRNGAVFREYGNK